MNIAIYSRKSVFTGKGESIDNQIQMCKEYANKYIDGYKEFFVYEDEGFSGGNTNRPEFKRMIEDIKSKKINALMCYRLDRISRSVADFSDTINILEKYNVQFISIKEQFDTSTPMGRAMLYISSVFAQLERETIAERIKDNFYELAKTGRWLGGTSPLGYKSKLIAYTDSAGSTRKYNVLELVNDEVDTVETIYNKYLELGNIDNLRMYLIDNGYKSRLTSTWYNVNRIICNPVYAIPTENLYNWLINKGVTITGSKDEFLKAKGLMPFGRHDTKSTSSNNLLKNISEWIIAPSFHEGIIDGDTWMKTYDKMKGQSSFPRQGTGKYGMLVGLLKCECGSGFRAESYKHDHNKFYYSCNRMKNTKKKECDRKLIRGNDLDEQIISALKEIKVDNNKLNQYIDDYNLEKANKNTNQDKENKLKVSITKIKKEIENLTNDLAGNSNSSASKYIIKAIESKDNQLNKLNKELLELSKSNDQIELQEKNIETIKNYLTYFLDNFNKLDMKQKREILKIIFKEIRIDKENNVLLTF